MMRGTTAACSAARVTHVSAKVENSGVRLPMVLEYACIASMRFSWTAFPIAIFGFGLRGKRGNRTLFSGVLTVAMGRPRIPASEDSPTTPSRKLANERIGLRVSNNV